MRFYIQCPQCKGLDLTDVSGDLFQEEVEKLKCNKCETIFSTATGKAISKEKALSEKAEQFIAFAEQDDFKWNGKNIEEYEDKHLVNVKGFIERTCKGYDISPRYFEVYKNILKELDKRAGK